MKNLITDVAGIQVGNAQDVVLRSGVTVIRPDVPVTAAVDVRGGGPGSRETALLEPWNTVDEVHAVVLAGGSAYGLDAASGAMDWLRQQGRGYQVADRVIPIVPAAIIFDLANGGDKDWGLEPPYRLLGRDAIARAGGEFALGNVGAGLGATTATLQGGLGSASFKTGDGITIGAIAVVNPIGQVTAGDSACFLAAPFETAEEFGGRGCYSGPVPITGKIKPGADPGTNTSISVVATDLALDGGQAKRVAMMAHDGIARAILPVHTPLDGDIVFVISTGQRPIVDPVGDVMRVGIHAADCLARSIARGVYHAETIGDLQGYQDKFGS
jgi:L-aminopeptidase/D-esterase-like protein